MTTNDSNTSPIPAQSHTVEIPLTRGYVAIVDGCDADLADLRWHAQEYRNTVYGSRYCSKGRQNRKRETIHQVILFRILGRPLNPGEIADHKDGNGLNNRRSNIRLANRTQNAANSRLSVRSTTGLKGASLHKPSGKYKSQLRTKGGVQYLGYFDTTEEAHAAYVEAAKRIHGEFANDGVKPLTGGGVTPKHAKSESPSRESEAR